MTRALLILALLAAFAPGVLAHEVRPAYLELRQAGAETYDVLWKVPGRGENLRLGLYVEFPTGCTNVTQPRASMANNAFTERWTIQRAGGLTGGTIHIAGLSAMMTDVLVRLERLDGTTQVTRLTPSAPSFVVAAAVGAMGVARTAMGTACAALRHRQRGDVLGHPTPCSFLNKPGHDLLYSGAELKRPYPRCIGTTSDHSTQRNDEASEGQ